MCCSAIPHASPTPSLRPYTLAHFLIFTWTNTRLDTSFNKRRLPFLPFVFVPLPKTLPKTAPLTLMSNILSLTVFNRLRISWSLRFASYSSCSNAWASSAATAAFLASFNFSSFSSVDLLIANNLLIPSRTTVDKCINDRYDPKISRCVPSNRFEGGPGSLAATTNLSTFLLKSFCSNDFLLNSVLRNMICFTFSSASFLAKNLFQLL